MAASCDRPEVFRAVFDRHHERVRRYAGPVSALQARMSRRRRSLSRSLGGPTSAGQAAALIIERLRSSGVLGG
jgi:hypothetical protein